MKNVNASDVNFTNFQFSLLPLIDEDTGLFSGLDYNCKEYQAEWNDGLNGYVITFENGKTAQVQAYVETDTLHADNGEQYLERYSYYDDLNEAQENLVNNFIEQLNFVKKSIINNLEA